MAEIYREYEIVYCDAGSKEIRVMEAATLMSESEARRCANSWQTATWVEGRRFSYREMARAQEIDLTKEPEPA